MNLYKKFEGKFIKCEIFYVKIFFWFSNSYKKFNKTRDFYLVQFSFLILWNDSNWYFCHWYYILL